MGMFVNHVLMRKISRTTLTSFVVRKILFDDNECKILDWAAAEVPLTATTVLPVPEKMENRIIWMHNE